MDPENRYVLFRSAGSEWAIPFDGVAEVLPVARLERPQGSPRALAGFMNLGGAALPVVRLAVLFGAEEASSDDLYHHVIRLTGGEGDAPVGLLVERVTDVDAPAGEIVPLDAGQSVNDAVAGHLMIDGTPTPLLDCSRILLMEERRRIEELGVLAAARLAEAAPADA